MIDHLEMVTKVDTLVNVKDVFQKMALDVIARLTLLEKICVASNELLPDALLASTPIPSPTQTTKCWGQGEAYLRSSLFGIHLLQVDDFSQKDSIILASQSHSGLTHVFNALGSVLENLIDLLPGDYKLDQLHNVTFENLIILFNF